MRSRFLYGTFRRMEETKTLEIGRNEPCPCLSGKKYKRCHGVDAAPKLSTPKATMPGAFGAGGGMSGPGGLPFDPSQLDPQWMMQFTSALQRMPRGQMQRLQAMMQKAMSGKDVSREAAEFERTLPPDLQSLMMNFKMPGMEEAAQQLASGAGEEAAQSALAAATQAFSENSHGAPFEAGLTEEQARQIVAAAALEGKISEDQAEQLLGAEGIAEAGLTGESGPDSAEATSKFGKLWRSIRGQKEG